MTDIDERIAEIRKQLQPSTMELVVAYSFWRKLKARMWKMQGRYEQMRVIKHRKLFRKRRR